MLIILCTRTCLELRLRASVEEYNMEVFLIITLIRDQAFLGLDIGKGSRNEITSPYVGGSRLDMCTRES